MFNERTRIKGGLPTVRSRAACAACKRDREDTPLFKKIMLSSLWGLGASLLSGIILVSIVSAIACLSPNPLSLIFPLALLALLPSNFLGGFISAKRCRVSALSCGITTAAMWIALSLVGALCLWSVPSSGYTVWQGILLHCLSVAFCMLGAVAGGIKRVRSRKKRRFG